MEFNTFFFSLVAHKKSPDSEQKLFYSKNPTEEANRNYFERI